MAGKLKPDIVGLLARRRVCVLNGPANRAKRPALQLTPQC